MSKIHSHEMEIPNFTSKMVTQKHITNKRCGFTLIEILVVIAIMAILFGTGYLNFRDFSRRKALSGVTGQIQGDLRLVQSDAITGQKTADGTNCDKNHTLDSYGFHVWSTTEYKIEANCVSQLPVVVKDVNLPSGITVSITSTPVINPLNFKILGQGTSISSDWKLTLTQTATGNSAVVTVTPGGQIQ